MNEYFERENIIQEFKELVEQAQDFEQNIDLYTEFMRRMILNTYSVN